MSYKIFRSNEIVLPSGLSQTINQIARSEKGLSERPIKDVGFSLKSGYFLLAIGPKDQGVLGWIEIFPLWKNWWGMFSIYVYLKYRRMGLGRALLNRAFDLLEEKNIYGATFNSGLKRILLEHRCKRVRFSDLPIPLLLALVFKRYKNLRSIIKARKFARRDFEYFLRENTRAK